MKPVTSAAGVTIRLAERPQVDQVVRLMVAGVSSDPTSIRQVTRSWWRRLIFTRSLGPRMLQKEMDTFVALRDDQVVGYLVVRYEGEAAGAFDWGLVDQPPDPALFDALLNAALDHVEARGESRFFYLGLTAEAARHLGPVLEENGFGLLDYQRFQMVGALPLAEPQAALPEDLRLVPQVPLRFGEQLPQLVSLDYPPDTPAEDIALVVAMHRPTLNRATLFRVERDGAPLGFVQQHRWQDELRLLLCLSRELWGDPVEQALVVRLTRLLGRRDRRVRVRTFSQAHLAAARPILEPLGLEWEESPWQRWVVEFD